MKKKVIIVILILIIISAIYSVGKVKYVNKTESIYKAQLTNEIQEILDELSFTVNNRKYRLIFEEINSPLIINKSDKLSQYINVNLSIYEEDRLNKLKYISTYSDRVFIKLNLDTNKITSANHKDNGSIIGKLHKGFVEQYFKNFLQHSQFNSTRGKVHYNENILYTESKNDIVDNNLIKYEYIITEIDKENNEVIQTVVFKSEFEKGQYKQIDTDVYIYE